MVTLNLMNLALVAEVLKSCACGARYTLAEWQALPGGTRAIQGGELYEVRHCLCKSTLYVPLVADATISALMARVENLTARVASQERDLASAKRQAHEFEEQLGAVLKAARERRRQEAQRAANQAPNPPGSVVVVSLDPSDPGFTTLRKVGGR